MRARPIAGVLFVCLTAGAALTAGAQGMTSGKGPFGGFKHDSSAPIEITSNSLEVHQAENLAIFAGDVVAGQGTLRLTADKVEVHYQQKGEGDSQSAQTGAIRDMEATGNVFISNGSETAKGQRAEYDVEKGVITMTGQVVLTQGDNVISGQRLVIDLDEGQGRIEGRVKSVFTPQQNGAAKAGDQGSKQ